MMKWHLGFLRMAAAVALAFMLSLLTAQLVLADDTPQPLPFTQNWSDPGLITANDDWDGVPGVEGYLGNFYPTSSPPNVDPQTILSDTTGIDIDVIANQTNPNTLSSGGVAEFDSIADPVVALQGSGSADAPFILLSLNTTGKQNITVAYKLRDIDGSADNAVQQVGLHFRVGGAGLFTNLPAGYVADATTGPSQATLVTPITVTLPTSANNQALVQIRIMTTNASGSDEWVGVDDISVTGDPLDTPPTVASTAPISGATAVPTATTVITLNFSEPVTATVAPDAVTLECPVGSPVALTGLPAAGASITVTPTTALPDFTYCTVTVVAAGVTDQDGTPDSLDGNGDGVGGDDFVFTFRTAAPGDEAPEVEATQPVSGAVDVAVSANVVVTFSEPVTVTTGTFTVTCANSGGHSFALSGGPTVFTLEPDADFARSEGCTVTVIAAQVSDQDDNDPPDNMASDYLFTFTTQPPDAAPAVSSTNPMSGAVAVAANANVEVVFSEEVVAPSSAFTVTCANSGAHPFALSGGPTSFTLNPSADFGFQELCTVTVVATQVSDVDTDDPPDNMESDYIFTFTTQADPCSITFTPIYQIQGSGATAAITGTVTTQGVVVGDFEGPTPALRGFYLQDAMGDGDPLTSDGVFVFNANDNDVSLGQVVRVTGGAADFQNQTQISLSGAPDELRICGSGTITPTAVMMPFPAPVMGVSYLERFEGMLVRFPQTLYVTEHFQLGRFGQVVATSNPARLLQPTHVELPGGTGSARDLLQQANNLDRIIIDDELNVQNPDPIKLARGGAPLSAANTLRGGDSISNVVGLMSYTWGGNAASGNAYRLRPINALDGGPPNFQPANPRPTAPPAVLGNVTVASFNVLNFFLSLDDNTPKCGPVGFEQDCRGANSATEFTRQRDKLLQAIYKLDADVVGFMELENTPGVDPQTNIVTGVNALAGSAVYTTIDTGVIGTDAIKVGFIYKPDAVTPVGAALIDTNPVHNRPPVAQVFETASGARFSVVVNHFKSKGCTDATGADLDQGDGQGCYNAARTLQADALLTFINGVVIPAAGDPDVLIIGDLNSYAKEDPVAAIESDGYSNLLTLFGGNAAYSYVFDGQWGYLDHALASDSLVGQATGAADYHINADEPSVLDYNVEFKSPGQVTSLFAADEFRTSDHDPVLVGLNPQTSVLTVTKVLVGAPAPGADWQFDGGVLGSFAISNTGGSVVFTNLLSATYHLTESAVVGYATTVNCGDGETASSSVAVQIPLGSMITCTFTNTVQPAMLTVTKVVVNDNGGTKTVGDFPLFVNGTPVTSGVASALAAGMYTVTETGAAGYTASFSGDCDANGKVTLNPGDAKTCTITNNDQPAMLTVTKVVVNDNGGTKTVGDFPLFVNGTPVTSGVASALAAGAYTVTETGAAGYTASFSGDCDANGKVTLNPGDAKTCTITNNDQPAMLTVTKVVVNDNGGTKTVGDFPLFVNGTPVTSGVASALAAGMYTVTETGAAGYTASFSGDCDASGKVTLNPGDAKTCTITNNDQPAMLTVTKVVVNDNGGTKTVGDFPLFVNGTPVTSGVASALAAGMYTVTETGAAGYTASFSGDCDANGKVTLNPGDAKTCTITNNDQPAMLTVTKVVVNDNGGTKTVGDFPLFVNGTPVTSGVASALAAGVYTVTETGAAGYTASFSGDCDANGKVTLNPGDAKTCTITNNDQPAMLTVTKVVVNDNGGTKTVGDFPLFVNGTPVTSGVASALAAGMYTVTETGAAGYTASFSGDCDASGKVTLNPGDAKTCTITNNDQPAMLTVTKVVVNDNGGTKTVGDFPLFVNGTPVTSGVASALAAGMYTVTETGAAGYTASFSGDCDANGKVTLNPGDAKTCTITNNDQPAMLTVTKVVVNDNGGTKTVGDFPLFVNGTPVTSGVASALAAGVYTVTETGAAGYTASFSGDCDASGKVTLNPGDAKTCTITNNDEPVQQIDYDVYLPIVAK